MIAAAYTVACIIGYLAFCVFVGCFIARGNPSGD